MGCPSAIPHSIHDSLYKINKILAAMQSPIAIRYRSLVPGEL